MGEEKGIEPAMCVCGHSLSDHIFGQSCRLCECRQARSVDGAAEIVRRPVETPPARKPRKR
jgi:hypothetical protein